MIANLAIVAALVSSIALAGCDQPQKSRPRDFSFATEDECEDAGMSDAFCDRMFPEFEDFFGKTKKPKTDKKLPVVKPVYQPKANTQPPVVKPTFTRPQKPAASSSSRTPSTNSVSSSRR